MNKEEELLSKRIQELARLAEPAPELARARERAQREELPGQARASELASAQGASQAWERERPVAPELGLGPGFAGARARTSPLREWPAWPPERGRFSRVLATDFFCRHDPWANL